MTKLTAFRLNSITEVVKQASWLRLLKRGSLCKIANATQMQHRGRFSQWYPYMMDRDNWARRLAEHFASGGEVNAAVLDLFNQRNFLEEIENQGLICLLNTIRKGRDNVKKALMIDDFLENKDITVTVRYGRSYSQDYTVTMLTPVQNLYSKICCALHTLQIDSQSQYQPIEPQPYARIKDIGIKPGSNVQVLDVQQDSS